jgi:hypothetical protein
MSWRTWLLVASAGALVFGAALPWVSWIGLWGEAGRGTESLAIGWEGDGWVTATCGLVIAAVALWARGRTGLRLALAVWVLALIAALVVAGAVVRITEIAPEAGVLATVRAGLFLTGAGALAGLAGGAVSLPVRAQV